jgi:hypothetical protein
LTNNLNEVGEDSPAAQPRDYLLWFASESDGGRHARTDVKPTEVMIIAQLLDNCSFQIILAVDAGRNVFTDGAFERRWTFGRVQHFLEL